MKIKKVRWFILTLVVAILGCVSVFAYDCIVKTTVPYLTLEQDVYYPSSDEEVIDGKYPVVFMVHNGYADKSAWGDFPEEIAEAGFFTVNITWQAWDVSQLELAIDYTLKEYADVIDPNRVAFVGGCHGGRNALEVISKGSEQYSVTTAVLLAVSEVDDAVIASQAEGHVPMLAYYTLNDEFGEYWGDMSKKVAEEILTEPKTVRVLEEPPHGNNIVTQHSDKEDIREDIVEWLEEYNQ